VRSPPARSCWDQQPHLHTFATDLAVTEELLPLVPRDVVVISESGVKSQDDVRRLVAQGARGVLVGESLMRAADKGHAIRALKGAAVPPERPARLHTRVKICGCTGVADVELAVEAGADAVGVILAERSERRVRSSRCARSRKRSRRSSGW